VTSEDTAKKYAAWGWRVYTIKGNNASEIRAALKKAVAEKDKPVLIIGKTTMGKGAVTEKGACFEGECETHGQPLSKAGASFDKTIENLGGDAKNPFVIFPEVESYYKKIRERKIKKAAIVKAKRTAWEKKSPELAAKWRKFFSDQAPRFDLGAVVQKEGIASRAASKAVLIHFAKTFENMIVSSADLSNSDFTDGFLQNSKAFAKCDFSGAFLQAGVSELTMAAVMSGMALHGGVIPGCGTFFVFSDYMKPAVRLACLMGLPVKYVWTHDAFRVGEDGPTHQPIEQEAQIRLLEQLQNHHGKRSMLVLRPADSLETSVAWKLALENTSTPTALLLSRQNIPAIPAMPGSTRAQDAMQAAKGAYIVKHCEGTPDIILVANGSEVATLFAGAQKLESEKHLNVRIVSAISEGLFRDQDEAYRKAVLPDNAPILGLTAGLPVALQGLVGRFGKSIGLPHFGYSAPFNVLDEKFGFTGENVFRQALAYLEEYKKNRG